MWRSSFLVNLKACRLTAGSFTNIWTPSQVFFSRILNFPPPNLPPCIDSSSPCTQQLWETLGFLPIGEVGNFSWEENFYVVVEIWGGVTLTIQTFFKAKKQHIVKIPSVQFKVKFCREENFFYWTLEIWVQRSGNRI